MEERKILMQKLCVQPGSPALLMAEAPVQLQQHLQQQAQGRPRQQTLPPPFLQFLVLPQQRRRQQALTQPQIRLR